MRATYKTTFQLQKLATAEGYTIEEYLIAHPEYKMTDRELAKWGTRILREAARQLDKAKQVER